MCMIASSCSKHNEVDHHAAVLEFAGFSKTIPEHYDFETKGNAKKHIIKRGQTSDEEDGFEMF